MFADNEISIGYSLEQDEDFSSYPENSLGFKLGHFISGVDSKNQEGWEYIFDKLQKQIKSDEHVRIALKNISSGYSDDKDDSLNQIVKSIYKKAYTRVNAAELEFIFKFCSPDGEQRIKQ